MIAFIQIRVVYHFIFRFFDKHADAGASSTLVAPLPGYWLSAWIVNSHLISRCSFLEGQLL